MFYSQKRGLKGRGEVALRRGRKKDPPRSEVSLKETTMMQTKATKRRGAQRGRRDDGWDLAVQGELNREQSAQREGGGE